MIDKKQQGKKNRDSGRRFENKVRSDLEEKGWTVSKWQNNVEFGHISNLDGSFTSVKWEDLTLKNGEHYPRPIGKLIPAKMGKFRSNQGGFPDFIAFKIFRGYMSKCYEIIGVEARSKGYLSKKEKAKCRWLLDNKIFKEIKIAKKEKKRGTIEYVKFE